MSKYIALTIVILSVINYPEEFSTIDVFIVAMFGVLSVIMFIMMRDEYEKI